MDDDDDDDDDGDNEENVEECFYDVTPLFAWWVICSIPASFFQYT